MVIICRFVVGIFFVFVVCCFFGWFFFILVFVVIGFVESCLGIGFGRVFCDSLVVSIEVVRGRDFGLVMRL